MNAGTPAVGLRPVRVSPALVDDLALVRALDHSALADAGEPDGVRWARAWLVGWQAVLHARGVIGAAEPWTVALPPADWPALRGDPEGRRQAKAIALLVRARLAAVRPDGALALSASAFVSHRAGLELDWGAAFHACRGEPAALLTLRAVVDGLVSLNDPAPLTLRELAPRTGYGEKQVRTALHRLVAAGVLVTREALGQPTRYRVTDALLGRARSMPPAPPRPQLVEPAAPVSSAPPSAAAAPREASRSAPAFRLSLNGATVTLAAGLTASVELDTDGVPHLHVSAPPQV